MENKESNALYNQLHDENATVQRNKELFEYEMTEVKLMLAGRFRHITVEDMHNAGADVVIRKPNLRLKERELLNYEELILSHPAITTVDSACLYFSGTEKLDIDFDDIIIADSKKISRTSSQKYDVGVKFIKEHLKEPKVNYTHHDVVVKLKNIEFPHASIISANQSKIDILQPNTFISTSENRRLPYKIADSSVEIANPKTGNIRTVYVNIPRMEPAVSVESVVQKHSLNKKQTRVEIDVQPLINKISMNGISHVKIQSDYASISDIESILPKKMDFHSIKPIKIDKENTITPTPRGLIQIQNINRSFKAHLTEDINIGVKMLRFIPTKHVVTCECSLSIYNNSVCRTRNNGVTVNISVENNMRLKKISTPRNISEISITDLSDIKLQKIRTLNKNPVICDDVKINFDNLPKITSENYRTSVACDGARINPENLPKIIIKDHRSSIACGDVQINTDNLSKTTIKEYRTSIACDEVKINSDDFSKITIREYRTSVACEDVQINTDNLSTFQIIDNHTSVDCGNVNINLNRIVPNTLKKCYAGAISTENHVDIYKISMKVWKSINNISQPQVDTTEMKAAQIVPVSDIIKKVQNISQNILSQGLTYDELCRRCVVPVRILNCEPLLEEIIETLKSEHNS